MQRVRSYDATATSQGQHTVAERKDGRKQLVHPIAVAKRSGGTAAPPSQESGANAEEK
jgi:hypothetical protein